MADPLERLQALSGIHTADVSVLLGLVQQLAAIVRREHPDTPDVTGLFLQTRKDLLHRYLEAAEATAEENNRSKVLAHLENMARQLPGAIQPSEGCWQLPAESGLSALCGALALADRLKVPYRVLFFHEAPKWIVSK